MINTKELRRLAQHHDGVTSTVPIKPNTIIELIDRLEAAESDALEQARLNGMGSEREAALMAKLEAAEKDIALKERVIDSIGSTLNAVSNERDVLRTRIEAMEGRLPYGAIAKILTEVMDIATANGANSRSIPDEYVEVAAWLCGIPGAKGE